MGLTAYEKITFVSSGTDEAEALAHKLGARYGNCAMDEADAVVALGGDGLMLQTLHKIMNRGLPVFGIHCGSVGFLMNRFEDVDLIERLNAAEPARIYPLEMHATNTDGQTFTGIAFNEVSLFRASHQAAKIEISVDDTVRLEELICDGVLIATPAGSTAYNLSAHGPILPIGSPLLAITPISPFRPRRWRGAILPNKASVRFRVIEADKRPVSSVADNVEIKKVCEVVVRQDRSNGVTLLFDPGHSLEERVLNEQFLY